MCPVNFKRHFHRQKQAIKSIFLISFRRKVFKTKLKNESANQPLVEYLARKKVKQKKEEDSSGGSDTESDSVGG